MNGYARNIYTIRFRIKIKLSEVQICTHISISDLFNSSLQLYAKIIARITQAFDSHISAQSRV